LGPRSTHAAPSELSLLPETAQRRSPAAARFVTPRPCVTPNLEGPAQECPALTHTDPSDIRTPLLSPLKPHVIVLFGATGDLARRKPLPGLLHLSRAGLLPECRIIGTSLDDYDDESFRKFARVAIDEFGQQPIHDDEWAAFEPTLSFIGQAEAADGLADAV